MAEKEDGAGRSGRVGVVVAGVVVYHEFCWWRRAYLVEPAKSN